MLWRDSGGKGGRQDAGGRAGAGRRGCEGAEARRLDVSSPLYMNRTLILIKISKECGDRIRARVGYRHRQSCNLATGAGRACCSPIVSLSHCLA